jgi:hypothetical protein
MVIDRLDAAEVADQEPAPRAYRLDADHRATVEHDHRSNVSHPATAEPLTSPRVAYQTFRMISRSVL